MKTLITQTPRVAAGSTKGVFSFHRSALTAALAAVAVASAAPVTAETNVERPVEAAADTLGVRDVGIFSDLDDRVHIALPDGLTPARVHAHLDRQHQVLILYVDDWPTKPYPLTGEDALTIGGVALALRRADRRELAPLLTAENLSALSNTNKARYRDRDDDGIPDPLDLLLGAHKTAINKASYGAGYIKLGYPGGDVPRDRGVCTDVVVRATRNAGLDIQSALHRDIRRAPRSYPMITGKGNRNIDHRRVKTLLPYFKRHWQKRATAIDDKNDPLRPGDVVFMDTFPSRSGPDHIGVVSDRMGQSGYPLIINNWTDGTVTAEMDLLGWVPVTQRFRLK